MHGAVELGPGLLTRPVASGYMGSNFGVMGRLARSGGLTLRVRLVKRCSVYEYLCGCRDGLVSRIEAEVCALLHNRVM